MQKEIDELVYVLEEVNDLISFRRLGAMTDDYWPLVIKALKRHRAKND